MATTFDVFPGRAEAPVCGALLRLAQARLRARLERLGVRGAPELVAELHATDESSAAPMRDDAPLTVDRDSYVWIRIDGVPGGTDGYFRRRQDGDLWESMTDEIVEAQRLPEELVRRCRSVGHAWWFRRSAGQPGIINLAYGFVAAALAELTDGILYSNDSAWDYARFPARAEQFYDFYFVPEKALDPSTREWAERCIAGLEDDLSGVE